ncbi:MAG: single-stranded-DNA-specific exonuclease RecJ [Candidatus Magasanikbacteria bacterium CG_4_10_14_0_8_um_filter_32_14]|uniref:Single-stranded-DNA-specific exonuclease RecJ n=1 Tax=Candidatus Magasanikbacteria bacterium CG_4_10_14_0_8_um_filter_32_14 TaxID=1974640 RepID=A0A2M7R9U7_9BACT|nr:MAG: single-stranded-DNA-specific exonuclease RecJ [Candidatus Magasanikbacteria bacterium CG_4_10_14_0_8_um_filter_32_14]
MQKVWKILEEPPQSFFEEFPELSKTVAILLYHRNIKTQRQIDEFLNPDYSVDIHDPYLFKDMKKAVKRIFKAIDKKEKIIIYGDYDADGVSASVILVSTLRAMGYDNVDVFLPHRETDGYGLNTRAVEDLAKDGAKLIITCDCGISNTKEVDFANEKKVDVIITDHHTIPPTLPKAFAIIHPKIEDEPYPDKWLSGGGVAFKLMQALLIKHKEKNELLSNGEKHESHEKWLLDMVAISSVADMVPLIGESRTLTKYGLLVLNKTKRLGLQKLLLEARIVEQDGSMKRNLDTYTIGFQIAPRINAAGRINHANVAYNLMMAEKGTDAVDLAFELDQNNKERQTLTEELFKKSIEQIEKNQMNNPVLFVIGSGWPTGLVGLIAGKIKEKYYKPTLAMSDGEKEITGSGRSIEGFNIIETFQENPELFLKYGGHPMACGFTLANKEKLEDFKTYMISKYNEKTKDQDMNPTIKIDAEIKLTEVDWELFDLLENFKPFGMHNDRPKYLTRDLEIFDIKTVGKEAKHLKLTVKQDNKIRKTIGWSLCDTNGDINWCKLLKIGDKIDMVFEIDVNEWNGNRELQLTIVDLRKSS